MLPVANLMIEHRLIERMVNLLENELKKLEAGKAGNLHILNSAVTFFKYYADKNHHGKEEAILFEELKKKKLFEEHKNMLQELILDHEQGRKLVGRLALAQLLPPAENIKETKTVLSNLIILYREHINKEDKQCFIPVMGYFSSDEQIELMARFQEFDRKITQDIFEKIVETLEKEV